MVESRQPPASGQPGGRGTREAVRQHEVATRINGALSAALGAVEALVFTRFMLLAFDAERSSDVVALVLDASWVFVRPFSGAFRDASWRDGTLEFNALLAMAAWFVAAMVLMALVVAFAARWRDAWRRVERRRVTHG